MSGVKLDLYSDLLFENDQDLYSWCSGQEIPKEKYSAIIAEIRDILKAKKFNYH
jgi:succinate dehydrogenase flavin-adding protein (antitoxin of CptAB toxin-antitoxin module)